MFTLEAKINVFLNLYKRTGPRKGLRSEENISKRLFILAFDVSNCATLQVLLHTLL